MPTDAMLKGYRILDLSQYLAGPMITRLLAEMGPEIIKVELAPDGDPSRGLAYIVDGRSSIYVQSNRGKKSVCVDWGTEAGLGVIRDLVAEVDVVIENFANGVLERRGLHYEALRKINPELIMVSISAYGETSPWSHRPGFDGVIQATSGLMHMTGDPEGPPSMVGFAIADNSTAVHGFAALGYAMLHRERTGEGQHIDIAMADVMFHMQDQMSQYSASKGAFHPNRVGRHHPLYCPVGTYEVADGYGFLLVLQRQWPNLAKAMGRPDLIGDQRFATADARVEHAGELIPMIEQWLLTFDSLDSAVAHCEEHHVPFGAIMEPIEAIGHPHFEARNMVRRVEDPFIDGLMVPGTPFKFSAQPERVSDPAPLLGEHNREVLIGVLGYSDEQISELEQDEVLRHGDR
jgi:CoA:oxalate CoA-transferase